MAQVGALPRQKGQPVGRIGSSSHPSPLRFNGCYIFHPVLLLCTHAKFSHPGVPGLLRLSVLATNPIVPRATMAWSHLAVNPTNLTCLFFGAFTSLFMLYSAFFKEFCYLGEANIAFITGIVAGPLAANIFNPIQWGNTDNVVLECTRVVLVVQCFAVAVELRNQYVERHWKSLAWILGPVMTGGWMISGLAVYFMNTNLSWKECMACAACFNAIDPILAATVVGKGRFAEKVPVHLQNLLLAESACNGITTTLALELSTHVIRYSASPKTIAFRFLVLTTAYEVVFGAAAGLIIGFVAQWARKKADENYLIDRDSLLSFYFAVALLCTGVGSALGVDEVLLGFFAGYAFGRDDGCHRQTEDAGLYITIDLLLNLSYFVFLGAIIPWNSYNVPQLSIVPWRLVVGTLMIFVFRRVPVVLVFARMIPDIKSFREALFYGHFGPIGPGAVFSALLVKATFESGGSKKLGGIAVDSPFYPLSSTIWPIVTFVVMCSSIVHGSSVPVWILGKHINTLPVILTYSQGSSNGLSWANRLRQLSIERSAERSQDAIPAWAANIPPGTPSRRRSSTASIQALVGPMQERGSSGRPEALTSRKLTCGVISGPLPHQSSSASGSQTRKCHGVPGRAYQFDNTVMFEDEAGEVLKRYTIPGRSGHHTTIASHVIGAFGFASEDRSLQDNLANDDGLRISPRGSGRKMNVADFIQTMPKFDPKQRTGAGGPAVHLHHNALSPARSPQVNIIPPSPPAVYSPNVSFPNSSQIGNAEHSSIASIDIDTSSQPDLSVTSGREFKRKRKGKKATRPGSDVAETIRTNEGGEASIRPHGWTSVVARRLAESPAAQSRGQGPRKVSMTQGLPEDLDSVETVAEKRRRLAALSMESAVFENSSSSSDEEPEVLRGPSVPRFSARVVAPRTPSTGRRVSWGDEVSRG
jgi:NhaP-type Na+/H+ or K+/H+ antiporter